MRFTLSKTLLVESSFVLSIFVVVKHHVWLLLIWTIALLRLLTGLHRGKHVWVEQEALILSLVNAINRRQELRLRSHTLSPNVDDPWLFLDLLTHVKDFLSFLIQLDMLLHRVDLWLWINESLHEVPVCHMDLLLFILSRNLTICLPLPVLGFHLMLGFFL